MNYETKLKYIITISVLILLAIFIFKDSSFVIRSTSTVALLLIFFFIDYFFKIDFRPVHYILFFIILFSSILLSPLYFIYPIYDKLQHATLPFITAFLVFHWINQNKGMSLKQKLTLTFFAVLSLLILFEFVEYFLDSLFDWKLRGVFIKNFDIETQSFDLISGRSRDTIVDLTLGTISSLTFVLSYFIRNRKS